MSFDHHFSTSILSIIIAALSTSTAISGTNYLEPHSYSGNKTFKPESHNYCTPDEPAITVSGAGVQVTFPKGSKLTARRDQIPGGDDNVPAATDNPLILTEREGTLNIFGKLKLDTNGNLSPALVTRIDGTINLAGETTITAGPEWRDAARTGASVMADAGKLYATNRFNFSNTMSASDQAPLHTAAMTALRATNGGDIWLLGGGHIKSIVNNTTPLIKIDEKSTVRLVGFRNEKEPSGVARGISILTTSPDAKPVNVIEIASGGALEIKNSHIQAEPLQPASIEGDITSPSGHGKVRLLHVGNRSQYDGSPNQTTINISNSTLIKSSNSGALMMFQRGIDDVIVTLKGKVDAGEEQNSTKSLISTKANTIIDASGANGSVLAGTISAKDRKFGLSLGSTARWTGSFKNSNAVSHIYLDALAKWQGNASFEGQEPILNGGTSSESEPVRSLFGLKGNACWIGNLAVNPDRYAAVKMKDNGKWVGNYLAA